jgi:methylenetetrahydrofolate reductase (NADPH)
MSPLAAASLVLQHGMDAVIQFNCRDRNRIALQSDIMGAGAIGVTSLVLLRGEKFPADFKQKVKAVFDIGAKRLLATAQVVGAVDRLVPPPGFLLGSNITVIDPPDGWTAEGVDTKAGAGSKFVQTQPCLHVPILKKYMAALVARKTLERISVIVQVPVLDTMDSARELLRGRRALLVPKGTVSRLESSTDFARAARANCSEVLAEIAKIPGVTGVNLHYRGDPQTVADIIGASGVRAGS